MFDPVYYAFPIDLTYQNQASLNPELERLKAKKPPEIKQLSEWLLKEGRLDLIGDDCPLSFTVEEKFSSPYWLRDFFATYATSELVHDDQSFYLKSEEILGTVGRVEDAAFLDMQVSPNTAEEPKRSRSLSKNSDRHVLNKLHKRVAPAECAAFIFEERPELHREELILPLLAGAKANLAQNEYEDLWNRVRGFWKEGCLAELPDDPTLRAAILQHPECCSRRLYYRFCIDPKAFFAALSFCLDHASQPGMIDLITEALQTILVLQGHHVFCHAMSDHSAEYTLFRCSQAGIKLFHADLDLHFARHPERLRSMLHEYRSSLKRPYGQRATEWKEFEARRQSYLETLQFYLTYKYKGFTPIVIELWSLDKDYGFLDLFDADSHTLQKLLKHLLQNECNASRQEVKDNLEILSTLSIDAIVYLACNKRPIQEWLRALAITGLLRQSKSNAQLEEQLFLEILPKYRHKMLESTDCLNDFLSAFSRIGSSLERLGLFINALQNGHSLRDIARVLDKSIINFHPGKDQFFHLPERQRICLLTSFYVHRDRRGLGLAKAVIKRALTEEFCSEELAMALKVVGSIPFHWSRHVLQRVLFYLESEEVEVVGGAIAAARSCPVQEQAALLKASLFARFTNPKMPLATRTMALEALGSFSFTPDDPADRQMIQTLVKRVPLEPQSVRVLLAPLLAQIPQREALDAAVSIIQSADWDQFESHSMLDRCTFLGKYEEGDHRLFIGMPEFMQSRSSLCQRIASRYAALLPQAQREDAQKIARSIVTPESVSRLEYLQALERLKLEPRDIEAVDAFYESIDFEDQEVRHAPAVLEYPLDIPLFRGINNRKGHKLFAEALIDLLCHGCVAADLHHLEGSYATCTWLKQGIAFLTHDLETVLDTYGLAEKSDLHALIQIDPAYVNEELRRGKARWEVEESINTALCAGIPRRAIVAIYLPREFEHDLKLIGDPTFALDALPSALTSDLFRGCPLERLKMLRKRLNDPISFKDKIRFIDYTKERLEETLLAKRNFTSEIEERVVTNFILERLVSRPEFHAPDHPFVTLSRKIEETMQRSPTQSGHLSESHLDFFPFHTFSSHPAGHGIKADGARVNLLEHTLEVVHGGHGGFGLSRKLILQHFSYAYTHKILQIAALFHDAGKADTLSDEHIERSCKIAKESLTKNKKLWRIDEADIILILMLIRYNDCFGRYFCDEETTDLAALEGELECALKEVNMSMSRHELFLLLFTLWIADASTLREVNEKHRAIYWNLFQNINALQLADLKRAKEALLREHTDHLST